MHIDTESEHIPARLRKDIVTIHHEVPVALGESGTRVEEFYSPRLMRWAVESWLDHVPFDADAEALRRATLTALADASSFRAYLRLPEAFRDTYLEELERVNERRNELFAIKRLLGGRARVWPGNLLRVATAAVCLSTAIGLLLELC